MIFIIAGDHGTWEKWLQENICSYFNDYLNSNKNTFFFWEWIEGDNPFPVCQGIGWEDAKYKIIASLYYHYILQRDPKLIGLLSQLRGNSINETYSNIYDMVHHPWLYQQGYINYNNDPISALYNSDILTLKQKSKLDYLLEEISLENKLEDNKKILIEIMDYLSKIRDSAIVDKIEEYRTENVVIIVGSSHIDNIRKLLPNAKILNLPRTRDYDDYLRTWLLEI